MSPLLLSSCRSSPRSHSPLPRPLRCADIDSIVIKSDSDEPKTSTSTRRNYNYRVRSSFLLVLPSFRLLIESVRTSNPGRNDEGSSRDGHERSMQRWSKGPCLHHHSTRSLGVLRPQLWNHRSRRVSSLPILDLLAPRLTFFFLVPSRPTTNLDRVRLVSSLSLLLPSSITDSVSTALQENIKSLATALVK